MALNNISHVVKSEFSQHNRVEWGGMQLQKRDRAGMRILLRVAATLGSLVLFLSSAAAQMPSCTVGGSAFVHKEGLAEQIGDVSVFCTGGNPGSTVTASFLIGLNANVTNRLNSTGGPSNITVTVTTGLGAPQPASAQVGFYTPTGVSVSGLTYVVPNPSSTLTTIDISGIRVAVPTVPGTSSIVTANVTGNGVQIANGQLQLLAIGYPSLLDSVINNGVPCGGSGIPATLDFPGLLAAGTNSSTVRVTEGFPTSFLPKSPTADVGVRILVNLSGYGSNAQVYVPNAIVGNTGTVPTSGGSFGMSYSGGFYTPGAHQLLLVLVNGADATGAGGGVMQAPSTPTAFSSVTQVSLANGAAYAVYEVLDSNPNLDEFAQIPVFVATPANNCSASGQATQSQATISPELAPLSTVSVATQTDPIPRFIAFTPGSDCQQVGDCNASYYPTLDVSQSAITFTGSSGSVVQTSSLQIINSGSGELQFTVTITYQSGSNWLSASPTSGTNYVNVVLTADPGNLAPGQYMANVVINAGAGGTATIPVTFNVGVPGPTIRSVVSAASQQAGPIAPGSFATIYGSTLNGTNVQVSFNGYPATVVYDSASQINVLVPAAVSSSQPAGVYATINSVTSNTVSVAMAANAPAIFNPGVLNQDNSINQASQPAAVGSYIQIFLTGLSAPIAGPVTVSIGSQTGLPAVYAGAVPSIPGLEQVNIQIPPGFTVTANSVPLSICIPGICSPAVNLFVTAGS